ncbi:nuclear transport factor 2 family protein [Novosphingobium piscinae]|uniref:Nuclear transport factor 2 family protein n=1 Tax=Novosphingobium piscinae TaxID=1507448 RepID=A0A7X1G0W4_9SPHN|nr:nuclear transport factor 2 family protein [Novosphingobium piscinae]MBC2670570.1 nuclear transport factor 2 family protein [Novosphingobium piscinae]
MGELADKSERLIQAYNAKDFGAMAELIAPDIDFAHFNRNFVLNSRDGLIEVLQGFAASYVPDRRFEDAEMVLEVGDTVIRQAWYVGTAAVDLPGFGAAGESFRLKFCSFMRFGPDGLLVEWKDFG